MPTTGLRDILAAGIKAGASDWHIREGEPVAFRLNGEVMAQEFIADSGFVAGVVQQITDEKATNVLEATGDADFALDESGVGRFRVNLHRQRGRVAMTLRHVKSTVPSLEDLLLPPVLHQLADCKDGIIFVAGSTGSGKKLIKDLHLIVTAPGGATYRGNVINGSTGLSTTGGSADTLNNIENVILSSPASGAWTVTVDPGAGNYSVGQGYALVITGNVSEGTPPAAPVAEFSGSPTSGEAPVLVSFTDLSSGTVSSNSTSRLSSSATSPRISRNSLHPINRKVLSVCVTIDFSSW